MFAKGSLKKIRATLTLLLASAAAAGAAHAAQLRLEPDDSRLVTLAGEPATIIVSNPVSADATILDKKVLIQGRNYGKTRIQVLDPDGNQLASFDVIVTDLGSERLAVYKSGQRYSYLCLPRCTRVLTVGDSKEAIQDLQKAMDTKMEVARKAAQFNQ